MRWGCLVEGREQRITAACSGKEGCCCWQERELLVKQSVHHIFSSNCFDPGELCYVDNNFYRPLWVSIIQPCDRETFSGSVVAL